LIAVVLKKEPAIIILKTFKMKNTKKTWKVILLLVFVSSLQAQELPEMVQVTGGTFTMGNNDGSSDEQPTHQVTLSDFSIGKTEITVAQYKKFCEEVGYSMPEEPGWGWSDNAPIVSVSWQDATFYCEWLTEKTGTTYTLPTEAQWEFAARGGNSSKGYKFAGGNSILFVGWFKDSSGGKTHPVASKKANELGLYDMSGNVWEWCIDWYDGGYYANSPSKNPKNTTRATSRVLRGGCWFISASYCRVANRNYYKPDFRSDDFGFRVVSF
jgi:formylglycine-generating enzyme required for sulfatase activity